MVRATSKKQIDDCLHVERGESEGWCGRVVTGARNRTRALFSWSNSAPPDSLCVTAAHCSISFVFGNNCPIVD